MRRIVCLDHNMTRQRKIFLICLNSFLVLVGLYFGFPSLRSHVPTDKRTPEQNQALVAKTTDIEKLRAIIKADDECIRADRALVSLFREGLIAASTVAVVAGLVNIVLVSSR